MAAVNGSVCRSTSSVVVDGDIKAMLWNGGPDPWVIMQKLGECPADVGQPTP
ncbi:hypothetical protein Pth03_37180 [Planotetraspora thailandica]|uniref:Uncharacterized protein n=2 Tax=Planotetraspora thailandica TaxID=487172 RepID=A0A8J3V0A0_9ACTN|nr:hypothetical protein Pth03_37180 [Planotetraspora thailandica]